MPHASQRFVHDWLAGHFLSTNGGIGEALNVGFFALQPHKALLKAAVDFACLGC